QRDECALGQPSVAGAEVRPIEPGAGRLQYDAEIAKPERPEDAVLHRVDRKKPKMVLRRRDEDVEIFDALAHRARDESPPFAIPPLLGKRMEIDRAAGLGQSGKQFLRVLELLR